MAHHAKPLGGGTIELTSYIRVYSTNLTGAAAAIHVEYYENGEMKDEREIPYQDARGGLIFHFIKVYVPAQTWIVTEAIGNLMLWGSVSGNAATLYTFSTETKWQYDQNVNLAFGGTNIKSTWNQELPTVSF